MNYALLFHFNKARAGAYGITGPLSVLEKSCGVYFKSSLRMDVWSGDWAVRQQSCQQRICLFRVAARRDDHNNSDERTNEIIKTTFN